MYRDCEDFISSAVKQTVVAEWWLDYIRANIELVQKFSEILEWLVCLVCTVLHIIYLW